MLEAETLYGIEPNRSDYYPPSAFQTPIYWLLQYSLKDAIDFIIHFTNSSVQYFAKLNENNIQIIEVKYSNEVKSQYFNNTLWNMYRGIVGNTPYLLQSMHMALEKFFLLIGKDAECDILQKWLIYILKNSESASLSAVVASIVLAYPDKTFPVANILFKTKEFIICDTERLIHDKNAYSSYSIGGGLDKIRDFYVNERLQTCKDTHRAIGLEHLFLKYQFPNSNESDGELMLERKKVLWEILDDYYQNIPVTHQTDSDKVWQCYLSRMDIRKMHPTNIKFENQSAIALIPTISTELKEYSETHLASAQNLINDSSIMIWSNYRFNKNDQYKQFNKYEENLDVVLKEIRNIALKVNKDSQNEINLYFQRQGLIYSCIVLLRDKFNELHIDDKLFCKDTVLSFAQKLLYCNYEYQIRDGVQEAVSILPLVLKNFTEDKNTIKQILLFGLFNEYPIGITETNVSTFSIEAINKISEHDLNLGKSFLYSYLILKPLYENCCISIQHKRRNDGKYDIDASYMLNEFNSKYKGYIEEFYRDDITQISANLPNLENFNLNTLNTAFKLTRTINFIDDDVAKITKQIIKIFATKIFSSNHVDYAIKINFLQTFAHFILNINLDKIEEFVAPFIANFGSYDAIADLFKELIYAEDVLKTNTKFWKIWGIFKNYVIINKNSNIIKSYLFATIEWKESTSGWSSFNDNNKQFFKDISLQIQDDFSSMLYSYAKLLATAGNQYSEDGIGWICNILKNSHINDKNDNLVINTIYYLEKFIRIFVFNYKNKIKKQKPLKIQVIEILNFLINNGSVIGFMIREQII